MAHKAEWRVLSFFCAYSHQYVPNHFRHDCFEPDGPDFAIHRNGNQPVECCAEGQREVMRIAGDDFSGFLPFLQHPWKLGKSSLYSRSKFGAYPWPPLSLKHQRM